MPMKSQEERKEILLQVGVKVFLKNENKKYLLLKRFQERYPNVKNPWDIPGGRIIPGTKLIENIKREVREETGLEIFGEIKLVGAQDIIRLPEKHIVRLTFTSSTKGTPVLDGESTEFKWLNQKEILDLEGLDEFTKELILQGVLD